MNNPSITIPTPFHYPSIPEKGPFWSFDEVELRLVEAARVLRRLEGGASPFAKDGPWSDMRLGLADRWDWHGDLRALQEAAERIAATPRPSREMISQAEVVQGWLLHIEGDEDRRIVLLAVTELAMRSRAVAVDWPRMLRKLGHKRGAGRLQRRYNLAITCICNALNREMRAVMPSTPQMWGDETF